MKKQKGQDPIDENEKIIIRMQGKEVSKDENIQEEWLDDQAMLKMFKISASTLYRLRKNGQIPFVKIGAKYIYPKTLINKFLMIKMFKGGNDTND